MRQNCPPVWDIVEFGICPRCLLDITPEMRQREHHDRCSLCNRPVRVTSDTPPIRSPKTDDINLQIDEAEQISIDVRQEREIVGRTLIELQSQEATVSQQTFSCYSLKLMIFSYEGLKIFN